jgi:DNA polymerase
MDRCPLCPGDHNCVPPDGPEDSDYLLLGEGPGPDEDRKKVPFCGKTGREVNEHYLPLGGLCRGAIRVNNSFKCAPKGIKGRMDANRASDLALLDSCASTHLYPELQRNHYRLIIPVGAFACRAIDPTIDLEKQHGFPVKTPWGQAFPMYHPAQGIHEPKKMLIIRNDWIRLGKYLRGNLQLPKDSDPEPYYAVMNTEQDLHDTLQFPDIPLACDTEVKRGGAPFCLTYSCNPGTGFLIPADRQDLLSVFQHYLDRWESPIIFHNWLFDERVVGSMGLRFPQKLIRDTMVMAYHLGNLPQGLKVLSYRLLGMEMEDFDDVVTPHSKPLVLDYYRQAYEIEWPKPEPQLVRDPKDGSKWKMYKPHSMTTKLKVFFTNYQKNESKDVFEAWDNWEAEHPQMEAELGPWPGKCITHVPFENVVHYACRDADATLRLWSVLMGMRNKVRKVGQEHW